MYSPNDYRPNDDARDAFHFQMEEERHEDEQREEHAAMLAREAAFEETPFCEKGCFEAPAFAHTAWCQAHNRDAANPVTAALNGWLASQLAKTPRTTPVYAEVANGLFVRVGTGTKKNRRAA